MPAMLAELLGLPQLTARPQGRPSTARLNVERETDERLTHLEANLPAVVSVGEKINEPRYPSFKGIMAAKKKPVTTLTVADLGIDAVEVGLANACDHGARASPKPPRAGRPAGHRRG